MLDVLVVDDDETVRGSISEALAGAGHRVMQAGDGEQALTMFASRAFDLVVCDVQMPKLDGLTLLRRLRHEAPGTAVVLMTTFGKIPDAIGSLRDGAVDYVTKPFDPEEFAQQVVAPIAERRALKKKFEEARARFVGREAGAGLVGTSLAMRQVVEWIRVVTLSDSSVMLTGESGTGKKLIARTIHAQSPRRDGPFVVVPCASLPEWMLQAELSELSGRKRQGHRDDWFRAAEGGTLVLDGVEILQATAQRALVRILDEPVLRARRDAQWQPAGVRVVSVMHDSPDDPTADGGLIKPLFFRLNAMKLRVPPLRERQGDLYLLVCHFLRELTPPTRSVSDLTPRAWKALTAYPFAGNVRELAWALEHALAAAEGGPIDLEHLPEDIARPRPAVAMEPGVSARA